MELTPYIGKEPVRSDAFTIVVSEADQARVTKMVTECVSVKTVTNKENFDAATTVVGRLKTLLHEIDDAKAMAKRPFRAVEQAIQNKALQVSQDLVIERDRIGALLNHYAAQVEAQQKAELKAHQEKQRAERERLERIAAEAREAQRKAEEDVVKAQDEAERARARQRAERLEDARLDAELDQELAEAAAVRKAKPPALVTGGRVDHPWKFRLVDIETVVNKGFLRCLRWELDVLACRDEVRMQLERREDAQPFIPGIEITRETSVTVRASA